MKEYKVVIAAINSQYIHSALAPWYLKAGIEKYGDSDINTVIVEGNVNQKEESLIKMLTKDGADFLGISCYIWNIGVIKNIITKVREMLPKTTIVLGGPEVSFNAVNVLEEIKEVDFLLRGEGERSIATLINAVKNKTNLSLVGGLSYIEDGEYFQTDIMDIDPQPQNPYTEEFYSRLGSKLVYLETSRGCPFSCAFCLSGRGDNVRFFNIEEAKKNILDLAKTDARTIKFVDRTFNCNKERAYELIDFIINSDKEGRFIKGTCFHFEVAADLFDDKTIDLLGAAKVGLIQMEAGLQSFNEKTLEAVERKTNINILTSNIKKLLIPGNIHVHIDLIAGLPLEDFKSFEDSFNKGYKLRPHMLQLGFLKLIHGSKLREEKDLYGYKYEKNPPYEVHSTKWLTKKEMETLHLVEVHLDKLYNSGRFKETLDYILEASELSPFNLYKKMGEFGEDNGFFHGIYLEDYMKIAYNFFKSLDGVNQDRLRDFMVIDRLSVINTGKIPDFLKKEDPRLIHLIKNYRRSGVRTGVAILHENGGAVWADYTKKDEVTGRYKLNFILEEEIYQKKF